MNDHPHTAAAAAVRLIRVLDTDRATHDLLHEWLTAAGFAVASGNAPGAAVLTIIDVPFARHGGQQLVQRVTAQYPGTPILALSPTLFSNVKCGGNCARALGVAGVVPKPIAREALIAAVHDVLDRRG